MGSLSHSAITLVVMLGGAYSCGRSKELFLLGQLISQHLWLSSPRLLWGLSGPMCLMGANVSRGAARQMCGWQGRMGLGTAGHGEAGGVC